MKLITKTLFGCVGFAVLGPIASAQSVSMGTALWNGYEVGMTKSEVKSKTEDKNIELSEDCRAKLKFFYEDFDDLDNVLFKLQIRSRYRSAYNDSGCTRLIFDSLLEKYGTPIEIRTVDMGYDAFDDPIREIAVWRAEGRVITLQSYSNDRFDHIEYAPEISEKEEPLLDNL